MFSFPPSVRETFREIQNDFLLPSPSGLARPCTLYFPARLVDCTCGGPVGGPTSHSIHGNPIPFPNTCQFCGGTGKKKEEQVEVIYMICVWDPKQFHQPVPKTEIRLPHGLMQTKGYTTDLPRVQSADRLVVDSGDGLWLFTYKLQGEPFPAHQINQDRYFMANWVRQ